MDKKANIQNKKTVATSKTRDNSFWKWAKVCLKVFISAACSSNRNIVKKNSIEVIERLPNGDEESLWNRHV
jgi:hypothetical protein